MGILDGDVVFLGSIDKEAFGWPQDFESLEGHSSRGLKP
jgi:hypothetical protein